MNRLNRLGLKRFAISTVLLWFTVASGNAQQRSLANIELVGLKEIPADVVIGQLESLPEIVEAMYPAIDDETYRFRVVDTIRRGFLSCGFPDSRVVLDEGSNGGIRIAVDEGKRFRWGEIRVSGIHADRVDWVENRLLELTKSELSDDSEKDEEKVWPKDAPATALPIKQLGIIQRLRKALELIGLSGADARIELNRDEDRQVFDAAIQLAKKDAFFVPPKQSGASIKVAKDESERTFELSGDLRAELKQLFHLHFEKPLKGITFASKRGTGIHETISFGDTSLAAEIRWGDGPSETNEKEPFKAAIVVSGQELLVSLTPDRPAWRFPNYLTMATLVQKSMDESEDGRTMSMGIAAAVSTDDPHPSSERGLRFTPAAWHEWFPPQPTNRLVDPKVGTITYTFGDHELIVTSDGDLISLTGTNPNGNSISVQAMGENELVSRGKELISTKAVRDILVRASDGSKIALGEVLQQIFDNDDDNHQFYIEPATGQRGYFGVMILNLVNDGLFGTRDKLPSKLATLYALDMSAHRSKFAERIADLEQECLFSPIAALVLGDLAIRVKDYDRAADYHARAAFLLNDGKALKRDFELLFDSSNLVGQIAENVDIKEFLQLGMQIQKATDNGDSWFLKTLLQSVPDATDSKQRRDNAKRFALAAFQRQYLGVAKQYCQGKMLLIRSEQEKIARKKKAKADKKKKR